MEYSEDQIKKYLNILAEYKPKPKTPSCSLDLIEYQGLYLCRCCSQIKGRMLKADIKDYERTHYQKKSVYHRKYYFEKKVNNISKIIGLSDDEKNILYENLLDLNSQCIKIVNKEFGRKRMISINFIIIKILEEMKCDKYKKFDVKINNKILTTYNKWWNTYKSIL